MLVGYMRVSSDNDRQSTALQRDALVAAGVDPRHLFEDKASGARRPPRPQGLPRLPEGRRHAGRVEARPSRPLAAPPARHRDRPARRRRRVPVVDGGDGHEHAAWGASVPDLRGTRPIRTCPNLRKGAIGTCSGPTPRSARRSAARHWVLLQGLQHPADWVEEGIGDGRSRPG
jgi:hypothetical protein